MSNLNVKPVVRGLAIGVLLSAAYVPGSAALAQEAILLETIGAVRMAPSDEVRRTNVQVDTSADHMERRRPDQRDAAN